MTEVNIKFLENDFTIIEKLGSGGMGQVFKAHQKSMDRLVAIKVLQTDLCKNLIYIERFKREARLAGRFCHPNAVQVFDIGENEGKFYFVMEYVNGISLKEKLRNESRFSEKYVISILKQILSVLKEAEKMKIIHRDIKPDNMMLTEEGVVKLADLGLAREVIDDSGLTMHKQALGTPHYMAPEQAQGKPIDMRVDQYSLGISAFHMLTGRTPFSGKTTMEILVQHVKSPMIKPSSLCKEITPLMDKIILRMTEKKPELRFQSVDEIIKSLDELTNFLNTKKTTKRKVVVNNKDVKARIEKKKASSSISGILILISLVCLILGLLFIFSLGSKSNQDLVSIEKSILYADQLVVENKHQESITSLKNISAQLNPADQVLAKNKINEIEKLIVRNLIGKIKLTAYESNANCEKAINELDLLTEKYGSNANLAKVEIDKLQARIAQLKEDEKKVFEQITIKAKEDAINKLAFEVNGLITAQKYKQAFEFANSFKIKNPDSSVKINQVFDNISRLEAEYGSATFVKIDGSIKNKDFDQSLLLLSLLKENCNQKDLLGKVEDFQKRIPLLKKENQVETEKKNRLEFTQAKEGIFSLLKIAEIKAAKVKLENYKASGMSQDTYDFFARVIDDYRQIYGRIEVGLEKDFNGNLKLNKMGNRSIDANITSVKNGIIQFIFMDSNLELSSLSEDWAQTYTAIATKITRLSKGCRVIRICHFAYANGDIEGAYLLLKEAESLGLEKDESGKYTKNIVDDYLNWLDIYFDGVLDKANSALTEDNKTRANQLITECVKKYGDSIIYKERKEELDKVLALSLLSGRSLKE